MRFLLAVFLLLSACLARADEFRPAYLEIRPAGIETYELLWKVPAAGDDRRLALHVRLPPGGSDVAEPRAAFVGSAHIERRRIHQPGGLEGKTIAIDGLAGSGAEVLTRIERADGTAQVIRLMPSRTTFVVEASTGTLEVARTYVTLGVEHILLGVDHLLFVLALLIIVRGGKRILLTITAFTIAHSLSLAVTVLGLVHVPSPPVEASIALSIVLVCAECLRRPDDSLTRRAPWAVAFAFGLLHGLGFASALLDLGVPERHLPAALFSFNVGVELGQLAIVATVVGVRALAIRLRADKDWARRGLVYAMGSTAAFWSLDRIADVFRR